MNANDCRKQANQVKVFYRIRKDREMKNFCVCVLVGLLRRKGRRMGEKRTPKTHWIRGGRLLSTSLHAATQRSKVHVFLDDLGYLLLLQYL